MIDLHDIWGIWIIATVLILALPSKLVGGMKCKRDTILDYFAFAVVLTSFWIWKVLSNGT